VALLSAVVAVAGCAGRATPAGPGLVASVASYDIGAGTESRFLVGLLTENNLFVTGGTARLRFFFLGEEKAEGRPQMVDQRVATFLPLPGSPSVAGSGARVGPASRGRGVYAVERIAFDRPGFYEVEAVVNLPDGPASDRAPFQVLPQPLVPAPGDRAPPSENLTVGDKPAAAVDSRAAVEGRIPDPELHRTTIADAIAAGRPALVVFATPVYCISKFCGPVTDMVEGLAGDYDDVADFIHVEIWHDFQAQEINQAAADWLFRKGDLTEPWVFLIGKDGRILGRWDNVATRQEIEPWLKRL
jgi:hypothetical protein